MLRNDLHLKYCANLESPLKTWKKNMNGNAVYKENTKL